VFVLVCRVACEVVPEGEVAGSAAGAEVAVAAAGGLSGAIQSVFEFLEQAGWHGYCILLAAFSLYICLSLPSTPVEIASGYLYGYFWGSFCGAFSKTAGSTIAFLLGRALGRRYGYTVPEALKPKLAALQSAPCLTMVGIRLAPLPLAVKNYGLSLCEVPLLEYVVASLIVNVPFSVMWSSTGASCHSLSEALSYSNNNNKEQRFPINMIVAGGCGVLLLAYLLKRMLTDSSTKTTLRESARYRRSMSTTISHASITSMAVLTADAVEMSAKVTGGAKRMSVKAGVGARRMSMQAGKKSVIVGRRVLSRSMSAFPRQLDSTKEE